MSTAGPGGVTFEGGAGGDATKDVAGRSRSACVAGGPGGGPAISTADAHPSGRSTDTGAAPEATTVTGPVAVAAHADAPEIGPARTLIPIAAWARRRTTRGLTRIAIAEHLRPTAPGMRPATSRLTATQNHVRPAQATSAAQPVSSWSNSGSGPAISARQMPTGDPAAQPSATATATAPQYTAPARLRWPDLDCRDILAPFACVSLRLLMYSSVRDLSIQGTSIRYARDTTRSLPTEGRSPCGG